MVEYTEHLGLFIIYDQIFFEMECKIRKIQILKFTKNAFISTWCVVSHDTCCEIGLKFRIIKF